MLDYETPIDDLIELSLKEFDLMLGGIGGEEEGDEAIEAFGDEASKNEFSVDILPEKYAVCLAEIVNYLIEMFLKQFKVSKFNEALKPLSLIKSLNNLIKNYSVS